jgi:hypothetical protein
VETGRTIAQLKEWKVFYTHSVASQALFVPERLEPELFVDMMRDIQENA